MILTKNGNDYYKIQGELYPRVSSIIGMMDKPQLVRAAVKVTAETALTPRWDGQDHNIDDLKAEYRRQWDAKAQRGTDIHAAIHAGTRGLVFDPDHSWAVEQAIIAIVDRKLDQTPFTTEQIVVSKTFGYAGTVDVYGPGHFVADWKTGSLWPTQILQLWAYANADHLVGEDGELTPVRRHIPTGYIFGLRPEGLETRIINFEDERTAWDLEATFQGLKMARYFDQNGKEYWT